MTDILFPTSVIGSLPRPKFVRDLIAEDCPIVGEEYRRLMGQAIGAAVALQETAGLDVIFEPGHSHTWAYADTVTRLPSGATLLPGQKTVDNEFSSFSGGDMLSQN